ncbi:MAG: D-2-hydroxyacid dehydrogenase [Pirellulales bacterium]|nr:D-2-hydroxyacid dehydrogenase [Pirellulales bacterium]
MNSSTRIVLCYPIERRHFDAIQRAAGEAEVVDAGQEGIATEIHAADIFCGHAKVPVDWEAVVRQGRLKWIQSSAAGLDHCLVPAVVSSDIIVTSASGVLADQVTEHTLGLILAWLRSLPVFHRAQAKREFIRRPTRDLHRKTIGIVGFGGVGRRLAQVLSSFKVRLLATDVFPVDKPDYVESLWPADRLDDLLPQVDILILCAPLTSTTRGMIGAARLAKLPPHALLVNVARGPLVVEADLVAALEAGKLAGAVVDVTEIEPLPESSKLWDLPNVIITPHVGGQSARRADDMTEFFVENLRRWRGGEPLNNLVDKQLGFPVRYAAATQRQRR